MNFSTLQNLPEYRDVFVAIFSIVLSYSLSLALSFTYTKTFQGLSFSKNFINSLVLVSIVVCTAMLAIGDNLARGLGMMGALAMVRFRTNLKDPRDMIFMFAAVAIGIATGVNAYVYATVGTAGFCLAAFSLVSSKMGDHANFDGMLRYSAIADPATTKPIEALMSRYCRRYSLVTLREANQGDQIELAYQVKLKRNISFESMLTEIKQYDGIKNVSFMIQPPTLEV